MTHWLQFLHWFVPAYLWIGAGCLFRSARGMSGDKLPVIVSHRKAGVFGLFGFGFPILCFMSYLAWGADIKDYKAYPVHAVHNAQVFREMVSVLWVIYAIGGIAFFRALPTHTILGASDELFRAALKKAAFRLGYGLERVEGPTAFGRVGYQSVVRLTPEETEMGMVVCPRYGLASISAKSLAGVGNVDQLAMEMRACFVELPEERNRCLLIFLYCISFCFAANGALLWFLPHR